MGTAKYKKGFTVVENVIAFGLISLAVAGFSGMAAKSLQNFRLAQDRYIAAKIAQEGIELAINKKSNHVLCVRGDSSCPIANWQSNLMGDFEIEAAAPDKLLPDKTFNPYDPNNKICILRVSPHDAGKFGYCHGNGTIGTEYPQNFTREVKISSLSSDAALVQSIVSWRGGHSLKLETVIYNI